MCVGQTVHFSLPKQQLLKKKPPVFIDFSLPFFIKLMRAAQFAQVRIVGKFSLN